MKDTLADTERTGRDHETQVLISSWETYASTRYNGHHAELILANHGNSPELSSIDQMWAGGFPAFEIKAKPPQETVTFLDFFKQKP